MKSMRKLGKHIYISRKVVDGLERVGKKYIRNFRNSKRTSYNRACLWMLQLINIAEKLNFDPIEECDDE
jgi:hypothetical protein